MSRLPNFKSYITGDLLSDENENKKVPPVRPKKPAPPPPRRKAPAASPRFSNEGQEVPPVDNSSMDALKNELASLKACTISRSEFEAMQKDLPHMHDELDGINSQFNNKLSNLMKEADEEKKSRYEMEVELDHVRKFIFSDAK